MIGMETDGKRYIEVDMDSCTNFFNELRNRDIHFCKEGCPVEPKNVFLGCSCRPIAYQKECTRLKVYNKRKHKEVEE